MMNAYKDALRKSCKSIRKNFSETYVNQSSQAVCQKIKQLHLYRHAKHIALYQAHQGEINLSNLWEKAPFQGKFCYFPVLQDNGTLLFLPATPATVFKRNRYDIAEPSVDVGQAIPIENLDIIFMPLVAFDRQGTRIGAGGGYYDKTLAKVKHSAFVGVAYDFQKQPHLNPAEWDVSLSAIITPTTTYWTSNA